MARLRVLHVVPDLVSGGAPRGVVELVGRLARRDDMMIELCVLGGATGSLVPGLAHVYALGVSEPVASLASLRLGVQRLYKVISQAKPDILHSHLLPADLVSALAVRHGATHHISHVRDTRGWLASRRPQDLAKKALYRAAFARARTRFLAVSNDAATFARRHLSLRADRVAVVLNGIDTTPFEGIPPRQHQFAGTVVIGSAGRLVAEKGHDTLVEAVAELVARGRDVRLEIAGDGGQAGRLLQLAAARGISDRVTLRGQVADMADFYMGIDVFVLPSIASEGLSRALLEALASGAAVVATGTEGVGDVITPGVNGLVVEKQKPSAMASAIACYLDDPSLAQQYGASGRRLILTRHTADRVAEDVARHYGSLFHHDQLELAA